jgi:predicted nucleotidyltransferase
VRESFDDFCRACLDLLKARRTKYVIIGGVAVTAVGEPRFTADLDAVIFVDDKAIEPLLAAAADRGFELDLDAEREAIAAGRSIRLTRGTFHFDLLVRSLFIEDQALERSRTIKVFRRAVRFPSPEDLLILKLAAGRPRDLLDAEGIMRRHGRALDRKYVERTLRALCADGRVGAYHRRGACLRAPR